MSNPSAAARNAAKARVMLVDDHPIVRQGLANLIEDEADLTVCAQVESADEALAAMDAARPDVIVIDVRPDADYANAHIAGARSIPIERLAADMQDLPDDVEVVAYCRGPYCVFADDAVRLLRRRGRRARRLQEGFPEWQRAKLPVETSP